MASYRKAANVWSAESDLAQVDLRDVVNPSTFALLLPKQKDELLQLLPKVDTVDETTITAVFTCASTAL